MGFFYICKKIYVINYTLHIDEKSKPAKALLKFLKALAKETDWIEIVKTKKQKK